MATQTAYCAVIDLLLGDVATSEALDPAKYVKDAADEIDSKIGFVFHTPIPVGSNSGTPRPVILLLKRLNSHLATGRLIMAAYSPQEDERLNAYGLSLVSEVELTLTAIASGDLPLPGVAASPDAPVEPVAVQHIAAINNLDPYSQVEAFYTHTARPSSFIAPNRGPYFG